MREKPYIISRVNGTKSFDGNTISADSDLWYCYNKNYPYIPVFGSIGTKRKAQAICKIQNESCGFE